MLSRRIFVGAFVILLCSFFIAGCDSRPTASQYITELTDKMKSIVDVVKTVTDDASARAASVKLKLIAADIKVLKNKAKSIPDPPADEMEGLKTSLKNAIAQFKKDMRAEGARIGAKTPQSASIIMGALNEIDDATK